MFKKISSVFLSLIIILLCISSFVYADDYFYDNKWASHNENIKLYFNDKLIKTDVPSLIIESRTLVPVRAFFENIGASVLWNERKREVTVSTQNLEVVIGIDSYIAYVNDKSVVLDVPAKIVSDKDNIGRTLVPVRFISEQLGFEVLWDEKTYSVYVSEAPEFGTIKKISVSKNGLIDYITFDTTKSPKPIITKISNPERLILDFYDFNLQSGDGSVNKSGVCYSNIRYANHENYCRVVVDISSSYKYDFSTKNGVSTLMLTKTGSSVSNPTIAPKPTATPKPTPTKPPVSTVTPSSSPEILPPTSPGNGLVVIDPGHGGSDPGAIGYKDGEEYLYESTVNLDISLKLYELLKARGVNVALTRSTDKYLGLTERAQYANNLNASLFICIHNNSAVTPAAHGSMVYYYTSETDNLTKESFGITSKELAAMVHKGILKYGNRYDRKIDDGSKFVVLYSTKMPAILTECAFLSNEEEMELLDTDGFRLKLAQGICEGVIEALTKMGLY